MGMKPKQNGNDEGASSTYSHRLGQIPRLVNIVLAKNGKMKLQKLKGYDVQQALKAING